MVSVIIPSYNSEATIAKCLNALLDQTYRHEYEIILVDSSADQTPEIVKAQFNQVRFFHLDVKTDPGTARNIGVKKSKGELILFTDSDCIVNRQWIEQMVNTHEQHPEYIAIGGAVENGNNPKNNIAWAGYLAEFRENIPEQASGIIWHNPTCNISYKRSAFIKYGFFDFRLYPQEDLVYNYTLTRKGEKIYFCPEAIVKHMHREKLIHFLAHQKKVGVITARVLKHIDLPGSMLARHKILFLLTGYVLPVIKFFKTILVFIQKRPQIITFHPLSIFFLFIGLMKWYFGFFCGVFTKPIEITGSPFSVNDTYVEIGSE